MKLSDRIIVFALAFVFFASGAATLAAFMIGALGTHVLHAEWGMLAVAAIVMGLAARHAWRGFFKVREADAGLVAGNP
jgi:putative oxidoreductase